MNKKQALRLLSEHKVLIVVAREKHGDYRYLATTEDELRDACCEIVKNRKDYYYPPDEPAKPELSAEQVAALPDGTVKQTATKQFEDHRRSTKEYVRDKEIWDAVQEVAATGDLETALLILSARSGYEYEGFEIEAGEKANSFKPFKLTYRQT